MDDPFVGVPDGLVFPVYKSGSGDRRDAYLFVFDFRPRSALSRTLAHLTDAAARCRLPWVSTLTREAGVHSIDVDRAWARNFPALQPILAEFILGGTPQVSADRLDVMAHAETFQVECREEYTLDVGRGLSIGRPGGRPGHLFGETAGWPIRDISPETLASIVQRYHYHRHVAYADRLRAQSQFDSITITPSD